CLVVVTSRSALAGLAAGEGARPLRLGPLTEAEAVRLLAARLGAERVAAEPGAVAELAARCGGLPLALAVMAARAAAGPGAPLGGPAAQPAGAPDAGAAAAGQPGGGGRAAADRGLPLGVLAAELAGASDAGAAAAGQPGAGEGPGRLEVLETGDAATSLRALLSWSHRQLSEPAAAMFALLGVHCGPDITVPAAASLGG